jgi:hypothetical protein
MNSRDPLSVSSRVTSDLPLQPTRAPLKGLRVGRRLVGGVSRHVPSCTERRAAALAPIPVGPRRMPETSHDPAIARLQSQERAHPQARSTSPGTWGSPSPGERPATPGPSLQSLNCPLTGLRTSRPRRRISSRLLPRPSTKPRRLHREAPPAPYANQGRLRNRLSILWRPQRVGIHPARPPACDTGGHESSQRCALPEIRGSRARVLLLIKAFLARARAISAGGDPQTAFYVNDRINRYVSPRYYRFKFRTPSESRFPIPRTPRQSTTMRRGAKRFRWQRRTRISRSDLVNFPLCKSAPFDLDLQAIPSPSAHRLVAQITAMC